MKKQDIIRKNNNTMENSMLSLQQHTSNEPSQELLHEPGSKKRAAEKIKSDGEYKKRALLNSSELDANKLYTEQYHTTPHRVEVVLMDSLVKKNENYNILQIGYDWILHQLGYRNLVTKDLGFNKVGIDFKTYQEANALVAEPSLAA